MKKARSVPLVVAMIVALNPVTAFAQSATPSADARPAPGTSAMAAPHPSTVPTSMASYFIGAWSCATEAGSTVVKLFGLNGDRAQLAVSNAFTYGGVLANIFETYALDGTTIAVDSRGIYSFIGTSTGWQGDRLVFDGTGTNDRVVLNQRMTYQRVDPDHFARTFAVLSNGVARVSSVEQCIRLQTPLFRMP